MLSALAAHAQGIADSVWCVAINLRFSELLSKITSRIPWSIFPTACRRYIDLKVSQRSVMCDLHHLVMSAPTRFKSWLRTVLPPTNIVSHVPHLCQNAGCIHNWVQCICFWTNSKPAAQEGVWTININGSMNVVAGTVHLLRQALLHNKCLLTWYLGICFLA